MGSALYLAAIWPVMLSILGLVVWAVRLEGRVNIGDKERAQIKLDLNEVRLEQKALTHDLVKQLSEVRESLARLEGALGIKKN